MNRALLEQFVRGFFRAYPKLTEGCTIEATVHEIMGCTRQQLMEAFDVTDQELNSIMTLGAD